MTFFGCCASSELCSCNKIKDQDRNNMIRFHLRFSPHVIIADQATNLIVEFVAHEAKHKVLSKNPVISNPQMKLFVGSPEAYLADCSLSLKIKCH